MSYSPEDKVTPSYNPLGKAGTLARAEAAKNGGTLDDKTRAELEAYVSNTSGQFSEDVVNKSKELLDYWNKQNIITVNFSSGFSSGAQSAYDAQLKAIEEQRTYAEKLAEQARQEAIKNAYINYDRSLSTYGQNAERLAQMGLTNSGYSDYLGGVAYSSMVGGVQDAHKTANDAIRDAYYNAELQKAQAADTLYNRQLAEEEAAYKKKVDQASILASVYSAVNNGEMDANTANAILSAYGVNTNGDNINGENPVAPNLTDILNKQAEEQAYNSYASKITFDTSDSEIEAFDVSPETKTKLKGDRDKLAVEEAKKNIKAGGFEQDLDLGISHLGKEAQQEIYFENALACIKGAEGNSKQLNEVVDYIEDLKLNGLINDEDANKLTEFAISSKTIMLNETAPIKYNYEKNKLLDGTVYYTHTMTFGGDKKNFDIDREASDDALAAISKKNPNPKIGDIIKYNNQIYVYLDPIKLNLDETWYTAPMLKEKFDQYEKIHNTSIEPTYTPKSKE